jgi:MtfA peptidase
MPGDTSFYVKNGDTVYLQPDSLPVTADSIQHLFSDTPPFKQEIREEEDNGASSGALITCWIFVIVFGGYALINRLKKAHRVQLAKGAYNSNFEWYHQELNSYNYYYRELPRPMQEKFVQRTVSFMFHKRFDYIDLEAEERMPLLISAAAVQITFGLNKYQLNHFSNIFIYKQDYQYGLYNQPFMGHVSADGIHVSWNNFLKGYQNYTDADNVGIHEMAHALAYVNFMDGGDNEGSDTAFQERFRHFSSVARPIFNDMQQGNINMLSNYAATNYHEFWAVAVETFFEKAIEMKTAMPALYQALCSLLNQDPLLPGKLLNKA